MVEKGKTFALARSLVPFQWSRTNEFIGIWMGSVVVRKLLLRISLCLKVVWYPKNLHKRQARVSLSSTLYLKDHVPYPPPTLKHHQKALKGKWEIEWDVEAKVGFTISLMPFNVHRNMTRRIIEKKIMFGNYRFLKSYLSRLMASLRQEKMTFSFVTKFS